LKAGQDPGGETEDEGCSRQEYSAGRHRGFRLFSFPFYSFLRIRNILI